MLVIAGDLTAHPTEEELDAFAKWVDVQRFRKILVCPGNHDTHIEYLTPKWQHRRDVELLIDAETVFNGLIIYATPWTLKFAGQNPLCCAYTCLTESQLEERYSYIPQDTDILISHSPPMGVNSATLAETEGGSASLLNATTKLPHLKLHVFGHIHEARGISMRHNAESPHLCVNAAHVDRNYHPYRQPPITVTLHH